MNAHYDTIIIVKPCVVLRLCSFSEDVVFVQILQFGDILFLQNVMCVSYL